MQTDLLESFQLFASVGLSSSHHYPMRRTCLLLRLLSTTLELDRSLVDRRGGSSAQDIHSGNYAICAFCSPFEIFQFLYHNFTACSISIQCLLLTLQLTNSLTYHSMFSRSDTFIEHFVASSQVWHTQQRFCLDFFVARLLLSTSNHLGYSPVQFDRL